MSGPTTDPRGSVAVTSVPTRRGTEALLLGFAVLITVVAQSIVDLTITGSLRPEMATFSAWITALWVVAHVYGSSMINPPKFVTDHIRASDNTDELIARGGFGSPTLFVGDKMFFGNDRLPLVRAALESRS